MTAKPDKNPWQEWLESKDGQRCANNMPTTLDYLENRLWWAFAAGYNARLKEAKPTKHEKWKGQ